ncbi:MAG: phosphoadenylyl-sulfate reductase [Hyphomicrobiaceae bacterium]|nr:phosphoadenylyl-sulfate reductase [Hyphomicrobiaceae bacterium]
MAAGLHEQVSVHFSGLSGRDLMEPLITRVFPGRVAMVSSFGAESVVLLHMLASIDRATPVIFLNTGKLFGETLAYREMLAERFGLTDVRDVRPDPVDAARSDPHGDLWNSDATACCWFRKVLPLQCALTGFSAWITGRKRFQSPGRASLEPVEIEFDRVRVNPLARWSPADIAAYAAKHNLPEHPLVKKGYPSIGCAPCTAPVDAGADARSGRWRDQDKSECGIHFSDGEIQRGIASISGDD